ncbi:MAG TPA: MFS transporter, partial [Pseudorhizobium sp.]|nr:MFS transporter [Pseudorhizobium sp.]
MSIPATGGRFSAFRHASYARFFTARFLAAFAIQIVSVSVGWQMYDETGSALYLGLIGLFQFLPSLLLILVTGSVADRYNRRAIVAICLGVGGLCALALLVLTAAGTFLPWLVFTILTVFGIERAFMGPAVQSLAPNLVPERDLANAIAWNSSSWQTASIVGPVAGGLLYGISAVAAYSVALVMLAVAAVLVVLIPKPAQRSGSKTVSWTEIL